MPTGLQVEAGDRQPEHISQSVAHALSLAASVAPAVAPAHRGPATSAAEESTPARRDSIKKDLSRTIAGKCICCHWPLLPSLAAGNLVIYCCIMRVSQVLKGAQSLACACLQGLPIPKREQCGPLCCITAWYVVDSCDNKQHNIMLSQGT